MLVQTRKLWRFTVACQKARTSSGTGFHEVHFLGVSRRSLHSGKDAPVKMMFLGAPGAGKGTYASRIAPVFGIPVISTGDMIRAEIKDKTALGKEVENYSSRGELVPDSVIIEMVKHRICQEDCDSGYLLDGFPRTQVQAEMFEEVSPFDVVANIVIPDWVLTEKVLGRRVCSSCGTGYNVADIYHKEEGLVMPPLLPKVPGVCDNCGGHEFVKREDDTPEIIAHRLKVYYAETAPLIEFYGNKGTLINFNVKRGVDDVPILLADIRKFLKSRADAAHKYA